MPLLIDNHNPSGVYLDLEFMLPWSVPLTLVLYGDRSRWYLHDKSGMFDLTIIIAMDPTVCHIAIQSIESILERVTCENSTEHRAQ